MGRPLRARLHRQGARIALRLLAGGTNDGWACAASVANGKGASTKVDDQHRRAFYKGLLNFGLIPVSLQSGCTCSSTMYDLDNPDVDYHDRLLYNIFTVSKHVYLI